MAILDSEINFQQCAQITKSLEKPFEHYHLNLLKYAVELGQDCSSTIFGRQSATEGNQRVSSAIKERKTFKNQKGLKSPFFISKK
ncbi:hypothetical protein [Mariniradius saccharolyticus]|uniref:hypothetical protein n=1 Tax=Mariniradius saccharolyticus TaxID=1245591 RepID=UPI00058C79A8|nr:hypothetical protein [Mariniradius saccharolyticus]